MAAFSGESSVHTYSPSVQILSVFTGIVEGTGKVVSVRPNTENRSSLRMEIDLGKYGKHLGPGDSVAINGVCLTATAIQDNRCVFEMIRETIQMTNLGEVSVGGAVNVERSLKVGDRLEGHFVLGHVDGTGVISDIRKGKDGVEITVQLSPGLAEHVVRKGSIAINGISLTVTKITGDALCISLIPHTIQVTNFRTIKVGDRVNVETDVLGKYALKHVKPG